jgi:electron transport complex protein RnfD
MLSSPHQHQGHSTTQLMQQVLLATVPGIVVLWYFFGWGILINLLWISSLGLLLEGLTQILRGRSMIDALSDYSALVTAVLLAVSIPSTAPWWLGLIGISAAILLGKQVYGGLGYNPFNPAMVGYVVLLISFPVQMTRWLSPLVPSPSFNDSILMFADIEPIVGYDAYTGATILDAYREHQGGQLFTEFLSQSPLHGTWASYGWEWVNLAFLLGGLYLFYKKIITWHISLPLLASLSFLAIIFHDGGSSASLGSPLLHLFSGATMLGAFFIATDPVSASTTTRGKVIYGLLIGVLIFCIRVWGNYPDAVAFSVLLGNFCSPLIDNLTKSKVFGERNV